MELDRLWPIPREAELTGEVLDLSRAVISLPGRPTRRQADLARLLADLVMDDHNRVLPVVRGRVPAAAQSRRRSALQLPPLRDRLRRAGDAPRLWSQAVLPERLRPLAIGAACNAPLAGQTWDLSGLRPLGRSTRGARSRPGRGPTGPPW